MQAVWEEVQGRFPDELSEMLLVDFQALTRSELDEFVNDLPLKYKGKLRRIHKCNDEQVVVHRYPLTHEHKRTSTSVDVQAYKYERAHASMHTQMPYVVRPHTTRSYCGKNA